MRDISVSERDDIGYVNFRILKGLAIREIRSGIRSASNFLVCDIVTRETEMRSGSLGPVGSTWNALDRLRK